MNLNLTFGVRNMESESKQVMQRDKQKKKLEVFDILKEAVRIFLKNINFIIIFTFLRSLPLFCLRVYFETSLQETLAETSEILKGPPDYSRHYHRCSYPDEISGRFSKNCDLTLIQLGLIYLVPLHVLYLGSAMVTIDLASKLRSG